MSSTNIKPTTTTTSSSKKVVAVIGGGVSGLAAAWHLKTNNCNNKEEGSVVDNNVHLYESDHSRIGGHAWTVPVITQEGYTVDVDIGFMVFNKENYPNMTAWFETLGIAEELSNMSFAVSLYNNNNNNKKNNNKTDTKSSSTTSTTSMEWSSTGLNALFANRKQIISPSFYTMLYDMIRFNSTASEILLLHDDDPRKHITTYQYLQTNNYSNAFAVYYLVPMMAALWSASLEDVLQFPASQLISFLCNHQMLQLFNRPTWKTVNGRSQTYTTTVQSILGDSVHLNSKVHSIEQLSNGKYRIYTLESDGNKQTDNIEFDDIIFACHPPQAAEILQNSTTTINNNVVTTIELLNRIEYADNIIYVHSDTKLMPSTERAWASWNCIGNEQLLNVMYNPSGSSKYKPNDAFEGAASGFGKSVPNGTTTANGTSTIASSHVNDNDSTVLDGENGRFKAVYITYWLNKLQNLQTEQNIFVSLNPHQKPDEELIYHKVVMGHPQFTPSAIEARKQLPQGQDGLWFCGAWSGYGFHEDGCRSGFDIATKISKVPVPWAISNTTDKTAAVVAVLPPPDLSRRDHQFGGVVGKWIRSFYQTVSHHIPVAVCKRFIYYFLRQAIQKGTLRLKYNDGTIQSFGDGTPCGCDNSPVTLRVFDPWFFVKTALEYDLGLARSYMSGYFVVEELDNVNEYDPVLRPRSTRNETNKVIGDPIGLTRLFLLLIGNRDAKHVPKKSARGQSYSNALTNASGLLIGKIGSFLNYVRYRLTMDNSERGGSFKNIHAHYDLSNDLFTTFLDKETLMYSSAIYDAIPSPYGGGGLVFRGTLEEAQWRKLDTLLARAQIQPGQTMLDIGFGWGGLSIHAAKKYGCKVTGITLSVEQKALAEQRVREQGLTSLITFEVVDYRTFARRKENHCKFDRVLSCEMIEAVGHSHLGEFFWAVEQVLAPSGILVMEAITTPEVRYETYIRSTDFINTIIFPGSCCPSLHALMDAAYEQSSLTLEHIDNIGLHYAQTLAEWRRRFNASETIVRSMGFDDIFLRAWNYYLTYCEAGFYSQTENCLILVFARQGCQALVPLCETRSVTQAVPITTTEVSNWITDAIV